MWRGCRYKSKSKSKAKDPKPTKEEILKADKKAIPDHAKGNEEEAEQIEVTGR